MSERKKRKRFIPETLYLGTNESIGKTLANTGIDPPVILSDVYAPFFAAQSCKEENLDCKWCIVEIDTASLDPRGFYPFHGYLERWSRNRSGVKDPEGIARRRQDYLDNINITRIKWHQSFDICGTVLYNLPIAPELIKKIATFDPNSRIPNSEVVELVTSFIGPWETTGPHHRQNWGRHKTITDWMTCELHSNKEDWMINREGLELFHKAPDKKK